jgi:hypothetical protein
MSPIGDRLRNDRQIIVFFYLNLSPHGLSFMDDDAIVSHKSVYKFREGVVPYIGLTRVPTSC